MQELGVCGYVHFSRKCVVGRPLALDNDTQEDKWFLLQLFIRLQILGIQKDSGPDPVLSFLSP